MARAIERGLQEQLIAMKQQGYSLLALTEQPHLCYNTLRKLSAQLKKQGRLAVHYQHCGATKPLRRALLVRAALWLRRLHPPWGHLL